MGKLSFQKIDTKAEAEGVWTDYADGIRFKIARLGNPDYRAHLRKIGRANQIHVQQDLMDPEVMESFSKEAIAKHVLLDWENVEDDDGSKIPYSPDVGEKILKDPAYVRIFEFVVAFAARAENYRTAAIGEALGNSSSTSAGTTSGGEIEQP
jgi:hypothetical protein